MNMIKILNVGGWYVGNSAILDWMDGFEELCFIRGDFNVARVENGIMDIICEKNIRKKEKIIKALKWQCFLGLYRCIRYRFRKVCLERKMDFTVDYDLRFSFQFSLFKALNYYKKKPHVTHEDEVFFWQNWLSKLSNKHSKNGQSKLIVLQNPFFYNETFTGHEGTWEKLFSPFKLVFVHRDPYDQLLDIINSGAYLDHSWPRFHGETEELHPIVRFHFIAKKIYEARLRMARLYSPEQLLIVSFESFVLEHDAVADRVKKFLGIDKEKINYARNFNPDRSAKNIGNGKKDKFLLELINGKEELLEELNEYRKALDELPHSVTLQ